MENPDDSKDPLFIGGIDSMLNLDDFNYDITEDDITAPDEDIAASDEDIAADDEDITASNKEIEADNISAGPIITNSDVNKEAEGDIVSAGNTNDITVPDNIAAGVKNKAVGFTVIKAAYNRKTSEKDKASKSDNLAAALDKDTDIEGQKSEASNQDNFDTSDIEKEVEDNLAATEEDVTDSEDDIVEEVTDFNEDPPITNKLPTKDIHQGHKRKPAGNDKSAEESKNIAVMRVEEEVDDELTWTIAGGGSASPIGKHPTILLNLSYKSWLNVQDEKLMSLLDQNYSVGLRVLLQLLYKQ